MKKPIGTRSYTIMIIALLACVVAMGGCGGSSSDSSLPAQTEKGVFIDSPVAGINYRTETRIGVTDDLGQYEYLPGETVVFFIGDLEFPAVTARGVVTPADIADGEEALQTNILQIVQSLDADGNPENGITIHADADLAFTGTDFDLSSDTFDTDVVSALSGIGDGVDLVSEDDANAHFENMLAHTFSQSDLTGTWYSVGVTTPTANASETELANNYHAEAGTVVIQSDGSYQFTTNDDSGSGTLSISLTGEITDTDDPDGDHLGWYMSAGKDVMTLVFNNSTHHEQGTIVFVKAAASYSQSDLAGTWYSVGTITPAENASETELVENYSAEAGTMEVQSDGSYQFTTNDDSDSGTLSISATGEITDDDDPDSDHLGWYMNAGKDVMTLVFNNSTHHEIGTIVFVKAAASYSQSDLAGTWYSVGTITPAENATTEELAENYGTEAGTMIVQSDGSYQFTTNDDSGSGTLSISATGEITDDDPDSDHLGWYMNAGKDVMTLVFNNTTHHEQGTIVLVKGN